jgi:ribosome-associated protein
MLIYYYSLFRQKHDKLNFSQTAAKLSICNIIMAQIEITPKIKIDDSLLEWRFMRASGPGGQNVNKVATAVKLRLNLIECKGLSEEMRRRLVRLAGRQVTANGILVIDARRFRTQERNRHDALARMVDLLKKAAWKPKARRPTRPSKSSMEKIHAAKQHRSKTKRLRQSVRDIEI